jgi:hypothetical protein
VAPHGLTNGQSVTISGATANTAINGTFVVTVTGGSTFTIPVTGNGVYAGPATFTLSEAQISSDLATAVSSVYAAFC